VTKDALLEIGSEELPASFIKPGMEQLKILAEESLKASGLVYTAIETYGTPRRLAVVIHGLPDHSPDQKKSVIGPPENVAKDGQGQWTAAALGFARKQGLKPSDLTIENGRLSAVLHIQGVATRRLLGDLFGQWVSKLDFQKSMEWEPTHFRYPRPIRWLAALYGSDLVSVTISGVRSVRWTLGLGPWSPKKITIAQPGKYAHALKDQCVLVDPAARQEAIRRYAEQSAKRVHGKVHMSTALLEEVANLVEHPVAILGNFDASYLDLPKEVLITCLEHHQKYFPVEEAAGQKLLPHFVGIRNGMSVHQEIVLEGYERVLAARLADARFFYTQDRRTPLSAKVEALKGVMFQEKLGNLFDKKERVRKLLDTFASKLGGFPEIEKAKRVAELCKADLVTDMVREFPELQGIVARLYAQTDSEDAGVAQALEEQYWPITLTSTLPSSDAAALVALADKLDTLAGDFAVGLIPSGSADPYGLRRAAVGVIRILEAKTWSLPLEWLIEQSVEGQPSHVKQDAAQARSKLNQFMQQRFAALLAERGFKPDEVEAVLSAGVGIISEALSRVQALHELRKRQEFEPLSVAFKRGMNIVRQAAKGGVSGDSTPIQSELFKEPCEQTLYQVLETAGAEVSKHLATRSYRQALESMVPLREPLDGFFNGVMVMAEDPALRTNRLALMKRLVSLFAQIADFSKLQNA
jgi:glycyl-tRNA synthetase beta chain